MEMKVLNCTKNILVGDKKYEVFTNTSLLEKMNWSWDSLIFATNNDTFATIKDESGFMLTLVTNGESYVFKDEDNTQGEYVGRERLSDTEIEKLALSGELYPEHITGSSQYEIDSSNWFCLEFRTVNDDNTTQLIEDDVFESIPQDEQSLIELLISIFEEYKEANM